jgi:DNA mismatch repair protein MutS2
MEEMRKDRRIDTVRKASTVLKEWKEKARAAEEDPVVRTMMSRTAPPPADAVLLPGRKVYVASLSREAEVAAVSGPGEREVEVVAGGMKARVPRDQVRVFPQPGGTRERRKETGPRQVDASPAALYLQTPENTLDLRGMYVDDAIPEVDAFLDRFTLAQAPHVFLIHGHGTGALKAAVRRHLAQSSYVKRSMPAPREQGGDGVTIVVLG